MLSKISIEAYSLIFILLLAVGWGNIHQLAPGELFNNTLTKDDLDKSMNMGEVGVEIVKVIRVLNYNIQVTESISTPSLSKMNKGDRMKELIRLCKIYFRKDKEAERQCKKEVMEAFELKYSSAGDGEQLLDQLECEKIYCLSDEVMNEPCCA